MAVLFAFSVQNTFKMYSFKRSKDMAWAPKCRNGLRDLHHAHSRESDIIRLILHAVN